MEAWKQCFLMRAETVKAAHHPDSIYDKGIRGDSPDISPPRYQEIFFRLPVQLQLSACLTLDLDGWPQPAIQFPLYK